MLACLMVAGTASGSTSHPPPRAALQGFSCRNGLDPVNRTFGVTAVMRPVTGTVRMAVKINLLVTRSRAGGTHPVHAGDLGTWINPRNPTMGQLPGDVWRLQKTVVQLSAPASYRFRVQYRWTGAGHQILATATRYSRRCAERELRPDLAVPSVSVARLDADHDLYTAQVANYGKSAAGPFEVLFSPGDGSAAVARGLSGLAAHSSRSVTFTGPRCTASTAPTITADAAMQVDDLSRANNTLTASCPS